MKACSVALCCFQLCHILCHITTTVGDVETLQLSLPFLPAYTRCTRVVRPLMRFPVRKGILLIGRLLHGAGLAVVLNVIEAVAITDRLPDRCPIENCLPVVGREGDPHPRRLQQQVFICSFGMSCCWARQCCWPECPIHWITRSTTRSTGATTPAASGILSDGGLCFYLSSTIQFRQCIIIGKRWGDPSVPLFLSRSFVAWLQSITAAAQHPTK